MRQLHMLIVYELCTQTIKNYETQLHMLIVYENEVMHSNHKMSNCLIKTSLFILTSNNKNRILIVKQLSSQQLFKCVKISDVLHLIFVATNADYYWSVQLQINSSAICTSEIRLEIK